MLAGVLVLLLSCCAAPAEGADVSRARATITAIAPAQPGADPADGQVDQIVTVRLLEGPYAGRELGVIHRRMKHSVRDFDLRVGQRVVVSLSADGVGRLTAYSLIISRTDYLSILTVIFVIATLLFGRAKGLASLLALILSGVIVIKILIPAILRGYNPIGASVGAAALITGVSFLLISGFTRKTAAAVLGTIGGAVTAGLLARYFVEIVAITGTAADDVGTLITELGATINYQGLFMAGILIGTLGVVMDVAMSISAVVFELKATSPGISLGGLIGSGLTVGRDVMATMVNTLILAYAGTSIPLFLIFHYSDLGYRYALNSETVAGEIIRALCGSVGLILTIPLTAAFAAFLAGSRERRRQQRARGRRSTGGRRG